MVLVVFPPSAFTERCLGMKNTASGSGINRFDNHSNVSYPQNGAKDSEVLTSIPNKLNQ